MLEIGKILKTIRFNNDLNQQSLADLLNVTKTYISLIENSKKEPSLTFLKNLSSNFGIPLWLLVWQPYSLDKTEEAIGDLEIKKELNELIPDLKNHVLQRLLKNSESKK